MTPIAHAGHWFISLLYVAPVLIVVGALALQSRRERERDRDEEDDDEPDGPAEPLHYDHG